jgi:hypothetical protein
MMHLTIFGKLPTRGKALHFPSHGRQTQVRNIAPSIPEFGSCVGNGVGNKLRGKRERA